MSKIKYRINKRWGYIGCVPIPIFWVQKQCKSFWGLKWVDVKGFEDYDRAEELLELLS